jgi:hypothetical protein
MCASFVRRASVAAGLPFLVLCAALILRQAEAQTLYGTLVGNISDPSNAAISGAKVVVVNTATGFTREVTTDDRGGYVMSDLEAGTYRVTVTAAGFAMFTQPDRRLEVAPFEQRRAYSANCASVSDPPSPTGPTLQHFH